MTLNKKYATLIILYICSLSLTTPTFGQNWQLNPDKSSIIFNGNHAGIMFTGTFDSFNTDITFSQNQLEKAYTRVEIDMQKITVSDNYYEQTLQTQDWFDTKTYPSAYFSTTKFEKLANKPDTYSIFGELTIKNITLPVQFIALIKTSSQIATLDADLIINRIDYQIGSISDLEGNWVSKEIPVKIHIEAESKDS